MEDIKAVSQKVKEAIQREGIEKASFTVLEKETQEFNAENGDFTLFRTLFDNNLLITVYNQQKKGSITTNHFDDVSIDAAVKGALSSAESAIADKAYDIAPKQENQEFHRGVYEPDLDKLFARTQEFLQDLKVRHPKIQMMLMIVSHEKCHKIYTNTNGTEFETFSGAYGMMFEFSANDGDKTTGILDAYVQTADLEKPFMELDSVEDQLRIAEEQLNLIKLDGKFAGQVILTPGCLGQFLYSICSNFVSDYSILNKTSIWLDKIGKAVADPRITISMNPSDTRLVSEDCYTFDGFLAEDYDVIQDGVLKSFMTSLYVSNKTGVARAKNSSFGCIMKNGDTPYEAMVKQMKKGLIIGGFSGGEPSSNGDFSGVAKNSFYVEDGVIKGAVSETMINGNLADMLNHVVAISKETVCNGASVLPYLAVDGIVVSSKN